MGASTQALVLESLVGSVFLAVAVWGFRSSLWVVVVALAAHGILDLAHGRVISGRATLVAPFCLAFDLMAAGYLAWVLKTGRIRAAT